MAVHACIGIENSDGSVRSCHIYSPKNIQNLSATLFNHYKTPQDIHELIDMGDQENLLEPVNKPSPVDESGDSGPRVFGNVDKFLEDTSKMIYTYIFRPVGGCWLVRLPADSKLYNLKFIFESDVD